MKKKMPYVLAGILLMISLMYGLRQHTGGNCITG